MSSTANMTQIGGFQSDFFPFCRLPRRDSTLFSPLQNRVPLFCIRHI